MSAGCLLQFKLCIICKKKQQHSVLRETIQWWEKSLRTPHAFVIHCIAQTIQQDDVPWQHVQKTYKNSVFLFCLLHKKQQNNFHLCASDAAKP